jgi:hypothetical protein
MVRKCILNSIYCRKNPQNKKNNWVSCHTIHIPHFSLLLFLTFRVTHTFWLHGSRYLTTLKHFMHVLQYPNVEENNQTQINKQRKIEQSEAPYVTHIIIFDPTPNCSEFCAFIVVPGTCITITMGSKR